MIANIPQLPQIQRAFLINIRKRMTQFQAF